MLTPFFGGRGSSARTGSSLSKNHQNRARASKRHSPNMFSSQVRLFETLENRFAFSVGGFSPQSWLGTPYSYSINGMGLPLLESLPGAPADIFLDFDGHSGGGHGHAAYDSDGNPASFSADEQEDIFKQWKYIANALAPFRINVTTVYHSSLPKGWLTFFEGSSGGSAGEGSFGMVSGPTGSVASGGVTDFTRPSTALHEIAHMLGLSHIETYDVNNNKVDEYASKIDNHHGVLMGKDWEGYVQKFVYGREESSSYQDDVAVVIAELESELGVGNALRVDDFSNSHSSSTWFDNASYPGYWVKSGVIEQIHDVDSFKFTSAGGRYSINVGSDYGSMLDVKVKIRNTAGTVIYQAVHDISNQASIDIELASGVHHVQICSEDNYADIGSYNIVISRSIKSQNAFWANTDVGVPGSAGFAVYEPASGTFTVAGSGKDIWAKNDEFHFAYQKLTGDGTIEAQIMPVDRTDANAKSGVMMRESLADNSRFVDLVWTSSGKLSLQYRTSTTSDAATVGSVTLSTSAPIYVKLQRVGNTFTGYYKLNAGDSWTSLASVVRSMSSTIHIGLAACSQDNRLTNYAQFKNVVLSVQGSGSLSDANPATLPLNALTAPTIGTISSVTPTSLTVSWSNVSGESGYTIEKSDGKGGYILAGTVAADVTSFNVTGLASGVRHSFRVRANGSSNTTVSVPSAAITEVTLAGAATNLVITSISTTVLGITWTDIRTDEGYRLERSTTSTFNAGTVTTFSIPENINAFIDSGLTIDTQYWYRVVTRDEGIDTATSAVATSWTKMGAVATFTTSVTDSSATLTWSDMSNETGYRVQELIDHGNGDKEWELITNLSAGVTTHTISNLDNFTEHLYRVVPLRGTIEGAAKSAYIVTDPDPHSPLPNGWTNTQIGSPVFPGKWKSSFSSSSSPGTTVFKNYVSSGDIGGTSDSFTFANVSMPVANITVTARISYMNYGITGAKAGVMIRQDSSTGSANVFLALQEESHGDGGDNDLLFRRRSSANGSTSTVASVNELDTPYSVRLVLSGSGSTKTVTAYRSADGVTWTQLSTTTTITLTGNMLVGLAVSSNSDGPGDPINAQFSNVTITGGANIVPFARYDNFDDVVQGIPFNGNVITNDYDPNGNTLTATKLTNPANGTITFNSNGTFTYTPNTSFTGSDSFTYRVNDGSANSNTVTVNFNVVAGGSMMMASSSGSSGSTSSVKKSSLVGVTTTESITSTTKLPSRTFFGDLGAQTDEVEKVQPFTLVSAVSLSNPLQISRSARIAELFGSLFSGEEKDLFAHGLTVRKKIGSLK